MYLEVRLGQREFPLVKFRDEEALIATIALLSGETQRARSSKMARLQR